MRPLLGGLVLACFAPIIGGAGFGCAHGPAQHGHGHHRGHPHAAHASAPASAHDHGHHHVHGHVHDPAQVGPRGGGLHGAEQACEAAATRFGLPESVRLQGAVAHYLHIGFALVPAVHAYPPARLGSQRVGHGHDHAERYAPVLACARAALSRAPGHVEARYLNALGLLDRHAFRAVVAEAGAILASRGDHIGALLVLADAQLELGDLNAAEAAVERALDIRPGFAALVRAAHLRHRRGDNVSAKGLYARAIRSALAAGQRAHAAWAAAEAARIFQLEGDAEGAEAGLALARSFGSGARAPGLPPAVRRGRGHGDD